MRGTVASASVTMEMAEMSTLKTLVLPSSFLLPLGVLAEAKPHSLVVWGDLCSQYHLSAISLKTLQGCPLPQDKVPGANSLTRPVWSWPDLASVYLSGLNYPSPPALDAPATLG